MTDVPTPRFLRNNLESFSIAIAVAILAKFFAIEAYQIPTSSMQPTMMGSPSIGLSDRILVDKTAYLFSDPERWDVGVFRFPIRRQQNYVKRIVGVPGDRLRISGGNVYQVGEDGSLTPLRRPEGVQDTHWKQIFPSRVLARGRTSSLGSAIQSLGGRWQEPELGTFRLENSPRAQLAYSDDGDGGLVNQVWDGYEPDVIREFQAVEPPLPLVVVQDARVTSRLKIGDKSGRATLEIAVFEQKAGTSDARTTRFRLRVENGEGRLEAETNGVETLRGDKFPLDLTAGPELSVSHLDDRLTVVVDGEERASLEVLDFSVLRSLPRALDQQVAQSDHAEIRWDFQRCGSVSIEGVRIDRDLHYLPSSEGLQKVFEVPEGHYFMLGDNTLQSVDSREWTSLTVGVDAQNRIVAPDSPDAVEKKTGNLRPIALSDVPDVDENPVPVLDSNRIIFEDDLGEVHVFEGYAGDSAGIWRDGSGDGRAIQFRTTEKGEPFSPEFAFDRFVPREDILGRPLLVFWQGLLPNVKVIE